jgi:hypothetical protein
MWLPFPPISSIDELRIATRYELPNKLYIDQKKKRGETP